MVERGCDCLLHVTAITHQQTCTLRSGRSSSISVRNDNVGREANVVLYGFDIPGPGRVEEGRERGGGVDGSTGNDTANSV